MRFESSEAERGFRQHFHTQRIAQDRAFAITQAAIAIVLALRTPAGVSPAISLLFCGTHAISLAVLVFSAAKRCTYVALRPYLLAAARAFSDLLCPQLVWHLAAHAGGTAQGAHDTWPAFCLLWVTWSRWGAQLLTQLGYLLPFYLEALLTPFGTLLNMLNNRRLCRLLTVTQARQRPFF